MDLRPHIEPASVGVLHRIELSRNGRQLDVPDQSGAAAVIKGRRAGQDITDLLLRAERGVHVADNNLKGVAVVVEEVDFLPLSGDGVRTLLILRRSRKSNCKTVLTVDEAVAP